VKTNSTNTKTQLQSVHRCPTQMSHA